MAQIINNGDVITIRANFPIVGLIEVLGWNDTTTGETGSVYFEKKIRWTYDGINWSDWGDLLNTNTIEQIQPKKQDLFLFEIEFTKVGPAGDTTPLNFTNFELDSDFADLFASSPAYQKLPFFNFIPHWYYDIGILCWTVNVLEKIFKRGLLADFIERYKNENREDADFISLFRSVCQF